MRFTIPSFALGVAALSTTAYATTAPDDAPIILPCTAKGNGFYDLRPLTVLPIDPDTKKTGKEKTDSWQSKGHDYPGNFSINVCAPVVEEIEDVVGIQKDLWKNVSAYYEVDGRTFSIGQQSSNLTVRGRKLVLQYTNGSPCGPDAETTDIDEYNNILSTIHSRGYEEGDYEGSDPSDLTGSHGSRAKFHEDEDDGKTDEDDDKKDDSHFKKKPAKEILRKSTTISFHCERDPLKVLAQASFVGTDPNQCAYFFEIRSPHACAGSPPAELGAVGPGGVFALITLIGVAVYFAGGVMYNRSVGHARGWRQLPNYGFWSAIWGFASDVFVIATSSCARCLPGRRGYLNVNAQGERRRGGRDDENRLIDDLDEEWDH